MVRLFKNLKTGVVWEVPEGSEAFKRCSRLTQEYEEVKPSRKVPGGE